LETWASAPPLLVAIEHDAGKCEAIFGRRRALVIWGEPGIYNRKDKTRGRIPDPATAAPE
jgi:hypothetical protein